jgi:hypothetical protein
MTMFVENWLAIPLRWANISTAASTGLLMLLLVHSVPRDYEPLAFMRDGALLLMTMHATLHICMLQALKAMAALNVSDAAHALERYRDTRRINHLDLAVTWLGFYALAPYFAAP